MRGEDRIDPVNGPSRATEFVGGAVTSPGIVDRAASTEAERIAAAAPADAAVLANNPHLAYANQAYKGYCILEAGADRLDVRYQAVHEQRDPDSGRLHPAALPRRLGPARGHRRGWSAAGVSPAAQRSSASTCAPVSPAGGSVVTSRVGAGREDAHARHESSWASSIHASGRSPAWASIAASFQCLRCAFLRGEGEERQRSGQDKGTEEVLVGLLLPSAAPDQVKGGGQAVQVLGSA